MGEVVVLDVITRLDIPVDRVLEGAIEAEMNNIVVIGYDKSGDEYFASSYASGADVLWALERAKKRLLEIVDDE